MAISLKKSTLRTSLYNALSASLIFMAGTHGAIIAAPAPSGDPIHWMATRTHAFNTNGATFNGYATDEEPVSIVVALKLRNKDVLDSYTQELFRPGSPSYHQFLTSQESTENFAPTQQQAQAVVDYLAKQGLSNIKISKNHLLVTADGTISKASNAFNTKIAHFIRNGISGIANTQDVEVPTELSSQVDQVLGLETLHPMHTFSLRSTQSGPAYTTQYGGSGYYPQEFATVYDAGSTPTAAKTTVAIIGWGSMTNATNDLAQMESSQGLAAVPTQIVMVGGTNSNDDSEQVEWGMDAQAIVGISGGVQQLIFYTDGGNYVVNSNGSHSSSGANSAGLLTAINQAVSDNTAKVINISWGGGECGETGTGYFDSAFQLGLAQGQTFSAASGDNGAYPCNAAGTGSYGNQSELSVLYPASSPYVIAIGGTTLTTTTSDAYTSEAAWAYGGGGISNFEPTPGWQPSSYPHREVPDLAFDADPSTGIILYLTASTTSGISTSGLSGLYGGTSLASPLFVGTWARLETANNNSLGFAAPSIYAHANTLPFHDVTTGNNGYYSAAPGWDNATGWGSLDIAKTNSSITQYWKHPNIIPIITELLL